MDEIIRTEKATKHFGKVIAVDGVDISVRKGEIYGFLGLNGAGKTTTIRMLLGMIRPTSGNVYLKGKKVSPLSTDLWKDTGYLVEIPYAYPDLTVFENLEMVRRLRGLKNVAAVNAIMEKLKLTEYRDRKAKNLSQGNGQRLGIAKALIHNPEILILDEPTNGLDPAGIAEIRELIKDLSGTHGVTILLSSHILGEISKFATRIGIIHNGKMVREVDADKLEEQLHRRLIVDTTDNAKARAVLETAGYTVEQADSGSDSPQLHLKGEQAMNHPEAIAILLVDNGCPPSLLKPDEEDLEAYFLRVIRTEGAMP